jgi:ketosteroid isomerase-like protein
MKQRVLIVAFVLLASASMAFGVDLNSERVATAEEYFRGIYGGDPGVVDKLASEDIVVSYPILQSVVGTPAIRGRDAVKALVARFGKKWTDPHYEFHETVCEGNRVVLLWSFHARSLADTPPGQAKSDDDYSWGGITLIRFDESGKISAEIGEESNPGPFERVHAAKED